MRFLQKNAMARLCAVFIALACISSCSDDPYSTARSLMEIGDYSTAIEVLSGRVKDSPKDLTSRKLLVDCYEANEKWALAAEQLEIVNNMEPSQSSLCRLFRLYAQSGNSSGYWRVHRLLEPSITARESKTRASIDSVYSRLNAEEDQDSLITVQYSSAIDSIYQVWKSDADSFGLDDWYVGIALSKLASGELDERSIDQAKEICEHSIRYFRAPVLDSIAKMQEPPEYSRVTGEKEYFWLARFYQERGELYQLIQEYRLALNEYELAEQLMEEDPDPVIPVSGMTYMKSFHLYLETKDFDSMLKKIRDLRKRLPNDQLLEVYEKVAERSLEERNTTEHSETGQR